MGRGYEVESRSRTEEETGKMQVSLFKVSFRGEEFDREPQDVVSKQTVFGSIKS